MYYTAAFRMRLPSQGSREGTEFFAMSEDSDVVGGGRPSSLVDVRRLGRVQQRTVEQIVDPVPLVPMLHDVVPQMVERLVDLLAPLDFRVAEQGIEVPKIVCPPRAARTALRAPQTAEQLVEVPTVLSYSSLQQLIGEQTVDIPVPGRAGGEGGVEVFKVSLDRIQQRLLELIVLTFPVEVFKALAQARVQRLVQVLLITLGKFFFFSHFSPREKVRG